MDKRCFRGSSMHWLCISTLICPCESSTIVVSVCFLAAHILSFVDARLGTIFWTPFKFLFSYFSVIMVHKFYSYWKIQNAFQSRLKCRNSLEKYQYITSTPHLVTRYLYWTAPKKFTKVKIEWWLIPRMPCTVMGCKCIMVDLEHPLCPTQIQICSHFGLANVTPGCCSDKLELIGALAKMSQLVTPELKSISILVFCPSLLLPGS